MDDSKFLITGANGQLGLALQAQFPNARATDSKALDISRWDQVSTFDFGNINVIINAAAYTNVDGAETPEGRLDAWKVNATGVANLVRVAHEKNILLIHLSTDYVFDGTKNPHKEDELLSPLNVYGASKAAGEMALAVWPRHYLLRTSWVIGEGKNFVRTMLDLAKEDVNPTVVADQIGRPTFTTELARAIGHLLQEQPSFGAYNMTNSGDPVSWADFAREIFKLARLNNSVSSTTTVEYYKNKPQAALRPLNSIFDLSKVEATGFKPTDWRQDLTDYLSKEVSR